MSYWFSTSSNAAPKAWSQSSAGLGLLLFLLGRPTVVATCSTVTRPLLDRYVHYTTVGALWSANTPFMFLCAWALAPSFLRSTLPGWCRAVTQIRESKRRRSIAMHWGSRCVLRDETPVHASLCMQKTIEADSVQSRLQSQATQATPNHHAYRIVRQRPASACTIANC